MREEVPAIIHKLSLDWAMRNQADECISPASLTNTEPNSVNLSQVYPYALDIDSNDPLHPVFSQANIGRLTDLSLEQHTLSPFTTSIPHSAFRSSTSLIISSRYSALKRRDLFVAKGLETTDTFYAQSISTSPPESVFSTHSIDLTQRPTLYNRRQRSSYLRRSHPPKRKVVRLRPSSTYAAESSSMASSASDHPDYFSEPGGYTSLHHTLSESHVRKERYGPSFEPNWVHGSFARSWNETPADVKETSDVGLSYLKERLSRK
jgi:hypothetical protein